jgi:hypothetical protein
MMAAQLSQGTVTVLPTSIVRNIPNVHFSCQHWTPNKGKPQGRCLCDVASPVNDIDIPLNGATSVTKQALRDHIVDEWDPIIHPTLAVFMRMILAAVMLQGWANIILWKKDLKGAFSLLWFRPIDVCFLAFPLTDGLSVLHLAGMFGWVGMPYVFQVLTRALVVLYSYCILGLCMMYVDDIMAVSPISSAASDMAAVDTAVTGLLGPEAIAIPKNELERRLVRIGWYIKLDTRTVTMSHRNLLKTLYAFFCFNITDQVTRVQVETMASLASRCSQLCRPMRPFTVALYQAISKFSDNPHQRRHLLSLAQVDVAVWRAFLVLTHFSPNHLSRPILSFALRPPTLIFKYDASLANLSIGIYYRAHRGADHILIAYTSIDLPFPPTTKAGKQNTFEFLTVSVGVLLCLVLGLHHHSCELHGNSISSLSWSQKDRAASTLARRSNIAYTLAATFTDITVTSIVHIPGKENVTYDGLTRERTAADVNLPPQLQVFFPPTHPIHNFLRLCDPDAPLQGYNEHARLSQGILACLRDPAMSLPHPIPLVSPQKTPYSDSPWQPGSKN